MVWRGPRSAISVPSADSDASRQLVASCSAHPSRGIRVGYDLRTSRRRPPDVSNAVARAPDVPTSTETSASTCAPATSRLPANQLLRLDLVAVESDERAVQRAGR